MMLIALIIGTVILAFILVTFIDWLFGYHPSKRTKSAIEDLAISISLNNEEFIKALQQANKDLDRLENWSYWPTRQDWKIQSNERGSVIDAQET